MAWNYAELSSMAKEAGGPEALVDHLTELGEYNGRRQMGMMAVLIGIVAVPLGMLIEKIIAYFKDRKKKSEQDLANVKREIIHGIKNYDLQHASAPKS